MTRPLIRTALVLTTLLSMNGSMAAATTAQACSDTGVCTVSLRMMTPPPPRPAGLAERHAQRTAGLTEATILPVAVGG